MIRLQSFRLHFKLFTWNVHVAGYDGCFTWAWNIFSFFYLHICKYNGTMDVSRLIQTSITVNQNICANQVSVIPKLICGSAYSTLLLFSLPFSTHPLPSSLVSPLLLLFPLCFSLSHSTDSLPPVLCPYLIGGWPLFS